jgi:hypothetical protein
LSKFEQERAMLEHTILELKSFEREYRIKIKAYIEAQLAELEHQATSENVNSSSDFSRQPAQTYQLGQNSSEPFSS